VNAGRLARLAICGIAVIGIAGCEREQRRFEPPAAAQKPPPEQSVTRRVETATSKSDLRKSVYDDNAYALSEGKRLFRWYNCSGCHAQGGGSYGPPLMDDKWIYGHEPEQIHETIVKGRPNGMPSFGGRIPDNQVWQLVAYVRSMSGLVRADAAPGRSDSIQSSEPESRREFSPPKPGGQPDPPS
jgi:cytochrome c oxidase cbb3-type subunit 3